jgi:hypothetical protein
VSGWACLSVWLKGFWINIPTWHLLAGSRTCLQVQVVLTALGVG